MVFIAVPSAVVSLAVWGVVYWRTMRQEMKESTWKLTEEQSMSLTQALENPAPPPNEKLRGAYQRFLKRKRQTDGVTD